MTKVGEEGRTPRQQTMQQYHKDLEKSARKFLKALEVYHTSSDEKEKTHLKGVMDDHLELIRAAVEEITRSGIHKEEVKVEHDYRTYLNEPSAEAYAALRHDLVTLLDYNKF